MWPQLPARVKLLPTRGLSADSLITVALPRLLGFRDSRRQSPSGQSARGIIRRRNDRGNSEREGGGEGEREERETDRKKKSEGEINFRDDKVGCIFIKT